MQSRVAQDADRLIATDTPLRWFLGNHLADILAKRGAQIASLGQCVKDQLASYDATTELIIQRLVACNVRVAKERKEIRDVHGGIIERRPFQSKRKTFEIASGHKMTATRNAWQCSDCERGPTRGGLIRWLATNCCQGRAERQLGNLNSGVALVDVQTPVQIGTKTIHNTHLIAEHRGISWCWRCGAWASSSMRKLAVPCDHTLSKAGKQCLARLRKGLTPRPDTSWPLPEPWGSANFASEKHRQCIQRPIPTSAQQGQAGLQSQSTEEERHVLQPHSPMLFSEHAHQEIFEFEDEDVFGHIALGMNEYA